MYSPAVQASIVKEELDISDFSDNEENNNFTSGVVANATMSLDTNKDGGFTSTKEKTIGFNTLLEKYDLLTNSKINLKDEISMDVDANIENQMCTAMTSNSDLHDMDKMKNVRVVLTKLLMPISGNDLNKRSRSRSNTPISSEEESYDLFKYYCEKCNQVVDKTITGNKQLCKICKFPLIFACSQCNKIIKTYEKLNYHINYKCKINTKLKTCPNCEKGFHSSNLLKTHIQICLRRVTNCCFLCKYESNHNHRFLRHLKLHIDSGHLKDDPNDFIIDLRNTRYINVITIFCSKCNKDLNNVKSCEDKYCHECQTNISFKCLKCNVLLDDFDSTKRHVKLHEEQKKHHKYHCIACSFTTDDGFVFKKHKMKKHFRTKFESLRSCWRCKRIFTRTANLRAHLKTCRNRAIFVCDHCSYESESRLFFVNHRLSYLTKNNINIKDADQNAIELKNKINDAVSDDDNIDIMNTTEGKIHCSTFRNTAINKKNKLLESYKNTYERYCNKCDKVIDNAKRKAKQFCKKCDTALFFTCTKCNKKFETYNKVKHHLRLYCVVDEKVYTCPNCQKDYQNSQIFQNHARTCLSESVIQCSFCSYKSKRRGDLTKHLKLHVTSGQIKDDPYDFSIIFRIKGISKMMGLFCSKCNKETKDINSSSDEYCQECRTKLLLKCLKCDDTFDNFNRTIDHVKFHIKDNISYKHHCLLCEYTANDTLIYNKHKRREHYGIKFQSLKTCWKCESKFKSSIILGAHLKICGNQVEFACDRCPYSTLSRLVFINHRQTHLIKSDEDVKDISVSYKFHCSKCNIKESTLMNAYENVRNCEKCSTEMSYECPKCNELFEKYYMIVLHSQTNCFNAVVTYKQQILEKETSAIYFCDYCDYKTAIKSYFEFHVKLHTSYGKYFTYERQDNKLKGWTKMTEWYCTQCKETSKPNIELLTSRVKCDKCNEQLVIRCTKCDKYKNTYKEIANHVKRICSPAQLYSCTKCDFKTSMSDVIRKHIRNVHLRRTSRSTSRKKKYYNLGLSEKRSKLCDTNRYVFCDHCPFKSNRKLSLKKHIECMHLREDARKI